MGKICFKRGILMKFNRLFVITLIASAIAACSTTQAPPKHPVQQVMMVTKTSYYNSIWFEHNSNIVKSDFDSIIALNADYLMNNPNAQIQVQGNASEVGDKEFNNKLATARAKAVVNKLISLGVNPNQIQQISFGATRPVFPSDKKGHSPQNRRVDIIYISGAPDAYCIDKLPTLVTEDDSVTFDHANIKQQQQEYKTVEGVDLINTSATAPIQIINDNSATTMPIIPTQVPPPPTSVVSPTSATPSNDASATTTVDALSTD